MRMRNYRLIVLGCVLSWFMLGLHVPGLHQMTSHGEHLPLNVVGFTTLFALAGIAGLWALLRPRAA